MAEAIPRWQGVAQTGYLHGEFLYPTEQIEPTPAEETESAAATSPDQRAAQSPAPQLSNTAVTQEFNTPDSGAVHTVSASLAETEPEIETPGTDTPSRCPSVRARTARLSLADSAHAGTPEPGVMNDSTTYSGLFVQRGHHAPGHPDRDSTRRRCAVRAGSQESVLPDCRHARTIAAGRLRFVRDSSNSSCCGASELLSTARLDLGRTGTLLCSYLIMRGNPPALR